MTDNLYYQIIYLSEALRWGFWDVWNMPTTMRRKFIDTYEEILTSRREREEAEKTKRQQAKFSGGFS